MSPIPRYPTRLPGELWGITAYFNPARYENKRHNLRRFADRVRAQGLKLLVVELAFGETPFEVESDVADKVVRRRTTSVLWQKERLLNIGLTSLPGACDKVAWLDGDVLFENDRWVSDTSAGLEEYVVVQPFEIACWLPAGVKTGPPQDTFGVGNQEGQSLPGMGYAMSMADDPREALSNYFLHGHTGFGWSARREVLDAHGFYDCQILGNGDFVMAHAMYGNEDFWNGSNWECERLSPRLLEHINLWGKAFYRDVRGSVFYAPGRVLHLWHGNQSDRQYNRRLDVLKQCDFDPTTDLARDDNDCWVWNCDKPILQEWASNYFVVRREE